MAYCVPADVRTMFPNEVSDGTVYPDSLLADLIDEFEQIAEEYRGIAYASRTASETITVAPGQVWTTVVLDHSPVIAVSAFTFNGNAIARYTLDKRFGIISNIFNLTTSISAPADVVVTYTHGLTTIPDAVLRACKVYARNCARQNAAGTSRDVLSQNIDGATTRYSTPDWSARRPTGYLEVDRLLNSVTDYRVPGIA